MLSYKRSLRFESENIHLWSPVKSPFETYLLSEGIQVRKIHTLAVKIEPPFESKQDAMGSYIWAWLNYAYVKFVM